MIVRDVVRVWLPVLVLAGLLIGLFVLFEQRYSHLNELSVRVTQAQERQKLLSRFIQLMVDAETGQRGFLLTQQPEYLEPLQRAAPRIREILGQLERNYARDGVAGAKVTVELADLAAARLQILGEVLQDYRGEGLPAAVLRIREGSGKEFMDRLRMAVQRADAAESDQLVEVLKQWLVDLRTTRWTMAGATALNVVLLAVLGTLLLRDINRRTREASDLKRMIDERTTELVRLSSHLQDVSEREKQSLGRELHDSLGGLLVATKMDVAWLRSRLRTTDPDLELRWGRIQESLDRGIDLKRRVVESLRPTLLDNMGLFAAIRWQFDETCGRTGMKCAHTIPDEEPRLTNEAAIALFRVAQESFTNILRHSRATAAEVEITTSGEKLVLTIRDNGRGVPADLNAAHGAHGIAGMRHRVTALGGEWMVARREVGGTEVRVVVPLKNILQAGSDEVEVAPAPQERGATG